MEESASMEIQLATASINNEDQNTQKEANISGGNENKNDKLVIEIREMVKRPEIQSSKRCCIYKVPHHLRKWNEEAYTPQVISIGPFHHEKERLKAIEEHKEGYFRSFVEWSEIDLEYLVGTIREMEKSIRGCYAHNIDLNSDTDKFVKMILVDACFILEHLIRCSSKRSDDPVAGEPRVDAVMLDLLLLENQLPFFVIEKLYDLASPSISKANPSLSSDHGLLDLSRNYFKDIIINKQFIKALPNMKIEHFTDLIITFQIPRPKMQPKSGYKMINRMPTATQLHEAGVKFMAIRGSKSCFDIKFEKGVLIIPILELSDRMEVVYQNIIALEQTHYIEDGYFTDYFIFMDLLMKTRKDVDLLCDKRILFNRLDDSYAVEFMIKNLNKGILLINMGDVYIKLAEDLNSFYIPHIDSWMTFLKREYFSTSSQATSTIITLFFFETSANWNINNKLKRGYNKAKEKLKPVQTKHNQLGQHALSWGDKLPSRPETFPSALHTAPTHELPCCNLFSHV